MPRKKTSSLKRKPLKRGVPKKGTLARAKKDCWDAFSLLKKLESSLDGEWTQCYTCDKPIKIGTSDCQGGHLFPKKAYPVHYFHKNGVRPQCYYCNINLEGNRNVFIKRMIDEIGQEAYDEMYAQRHDEVKITKKEYEEMTEQYKDRIRKIRESL